MSDQTPIGVESKRVIEKIAQSVEHLRDPAEVVKHAADKAEVKLEGIAAKAAAKVIEESSQRAEEVKAVAIDTAAKLKELAVLVARELVAGVVDELTKAMIDQKRVIDEDFAAVRGEMQAVHDSLMKIDENIVLLGTQMKEVRRVVFKDVHVDGPETL